MSSLRIQKLYRCLSPSASLLVKGRLNGIVGCISSSSHQNQRSLCLTSSTSRIYGDCGSESKFKSQVLQNFPKRHYGSIYEPEYLEKLGPEIPTHDILNITIKGYDFSVLEKYSKYVHRTAERIGLSVEDSWGIPAKKYKITKLKPESTVVDSEYLLNKYERNVQITEVPAIILPILINVVQASLPTGVSLSIHPHLPEHTENRFVPDIELKKLRAQLEEMRPKKD